MTEIDLTCKPSSTGWVCEVTVRNDHETRHRVHVTRADLARLAPGASDPEALVRASVDFLRERESNESILREFDLSAIGQYFPEYEGEIRHRLHG
ncbi:MAG TPA: hypothetical protein VNF71_02290 [Acidimicrobiales bacterium]|nr:hypothetical protein [Acidimicrobiales bacterium]